MVANKITQTMKKIFTFFICAELLFCSCQNSSAQQNKGKEVITAAQVDKPSLIDSSIVYKTDNLIIQRLSNHIYVHTSFLNTNDYGKVACNGMIVVTGNEAIVFDTPTDDEGSGELINYIVNKFQCKIKAVIPTHFHKDCLGGLEKFNEFNIPAYALNKTIELLNNNGKKFSKPINGFNDSLVLNVGNEKVYVKYFGEGHTKDNIIGYFPEDKAIFGGCLIKELGAGKGYLEDANTKEWSETVRKIKQQYPQIGIVIPGHGKSGGAELFDYTIKLFE